MLILARRASGASAVFLIHIAAFFHVGSPAKQQSMLSQRGQVPDSNTGSRRELQDFLVVKLGDAGESPFLAC